MVLQRFAAALALALATALGGCGGDETATTPGGDAGLAWPCPAGELELEDGSCLAPGVAPEACPAGFTPDGQNGCDVLLPAEPCPAGQMALPGEATCREVASCGDGTWGEIATDDATQFVDQAYQSADSDGTQARPWPTIQQGVSAAAPGAVVAVAAGSYAEDVEISAAPVTLWGRCPSMVAVTGAGAGAGTVFVHGQASEGTVVRGLEISAGTRGILVSGSQATVEQVWVHGTSTVGILLQDNDGAATLAVRDALIEDAGMGGIGVFGLPATIERTVVRDTVTSSPSGGGGIFVGGGVASGRAAASVTGCVLERNGPAGLMAFEADVVLEATVVRDNTTSGGEEGAGIYLGATPGTSPPASFVGRGSRIERNQGIGLFASGWNVTVEACTFRDQQTTPGGDHGFGLAAQDVEAPTARPTLSVRSSSFAGDRSWAVGLLGVVGTIEATVIRDVLPRQTDGEFGRGIEIEPFAATGMPAEALVRGCLIERATEAAMVVVGSAATIEGVLATDTSPRPIDGLTGRGLNVQSAPGGPATVTVRQSRFANQFDMGVVVVDSLLTIEDSEVSTVWPESATQLYGDGVAAVSQAGLANVTLRRVRIAAASRAGIASFGGLVVLEASSIDCAPIPLDGEPNGAATPSFQDLGGNDCGCAGSPAACQVMSAGLAPPAPL